MNKCRTDQSSYHDPDDVMTPAEERAEEKRINERIGDFYTFAEADSMETQVCFECGIDSLMKVERDWADVWCALSNALGSGKFPDLKTHIDQYVRSAIENGNDSWA